MVDVGFDSLKFEMGVVVGGDLDGGKGDRVVDEQGQSTTTMFGDVCGRDCQLKGGGGPLGKVTTPPKKAETGKTMMTNDEAK